MHEAITIGDQVRIYIQGGERLKAAKLRPRVDATGGRSAAGARRLTTPLYWRGL
jgi:hypothetical protein